MATHSSILAWKIPQTEEPGRLQSMGRKGSDIKQFFSNKETRTEKEKGKVDKEKKGEKHN